MAEEIKKNGKNVEIPDELLDAVAGGYTDAENTESFLLAQQGKCKIKEYNAYFGF